MTTRTKILIAAVVAVPLAALGWWLGSPLFLDRTVDEEFPMSASAEIPPDMSRDEVEETMEEAAEAPPEPVEEDMPEPPEQPEQPDPASETEADDQPSGPVAVLSGEFRDADASHQGSGAATVYELEDGSRVLRFEDFEVTNGPQLHVLLVPHEDPQSRDDLTGYVDLGPLKGNIGNQNYEIPPDVDLSEYGSVVIYCVPFHVLFAIAPISPTQG